MYEIVIPYEMTAMELYHNTSYTIKIVMAIGHIYSVHATYYAHCLYLNAFNCVGVALVAFCYISFIASGLSYDYHNATEAILKYMGKQVI